MSSKGQELLPLVTIVSWRRKINKKHWLKRPTKHSPKRQNLDQNINDSKSHNLEFFFWKYFFGHNIFLYLSSRKDHTFYNTVSLKKTSLILRTSAHLTLITNFTANMFLFGVRKDICTAAFLGVQWLHFWTTLKANVCIFLYISLKKLCSRDVVRSYLVGGGIGEAEKFP